jgi:sulfoxide reductase heme-binding subunit YedZ
VRRLVDSRYVLWLVLAAPAAWWLQGYWRETLFYGEVVHATGLLSARLLLLTLALTPLARLWPRARWLGWLRRRRRYFGVAAFAYAAIHAAVYAMRKPDLAAILAEAAEPALWTGWIGFVIMLPLALTSNDWSLRALKRHWRVLHRGAYFAAALAYTHWVLSAFDPIPGYAHVAVLVAVQALRFVRRATAQSARP